MKSVRPASAEMLLRRTSYVQILLLLCAVCRLTPAFPTQTPPSYDEALRLQVSIPHSGPVLASLGSSISMPCLMSLSSIPTSTSSTPVVPRIKWTVVSGGVETQILVARGQRVKINEAYRNRAALYNYTSSLDDLSLWLGDLRHTDSGHYRCEVQRGLEDASDHIQLKVKGVVFHYRDAFGRYAFSFQQAQGACEAIGAQIATPDQLLAAYNDGYEQCDAGWLADQSVRYPIQMPREACYGDMDGQPGVRNYGTMDAENLFDVYCFIEQINGEVFHDSVPQHLSFEEAKSYCKAAGAELATTAQLYSAWSEGLDHCSPGWLSDGSVRYPIINPRERCGGPQAGVKTLYRFSNQTGFPEPSSLHDVYCFRENRRTSSDPPMDYMTTEPEESAHNVVILMENDQELQLNQQSEQVEREAQSILESLPFFSVSITPKTSDDTTSTVIADTTDSPASTTSAVDQLHPFNKTSEMSHSLHPTAVNSTITSTETYNHIQNTSFLPSVHNETDSHQNLSFTFQSGLERTTSEPHTQNQPVPDTNLLETPQPSAKPRQLHDIHETSLNFSRAQANYSETDSNHTQDAGFWEAATLSIDSMLQVKLGEAAVEDPLQKPLTTQTSKEGTTPTEVAQMVESATEALTSLWPNMDGSGDISKERDFQVDGATFLSSSPSYAASFMTHPSPSAMASSAPITYQTDAPDPTLMSGSHHLEKVDFDNATVPQFGEFSISRQEGSTSLEMEDTLNMENEEKQLYATQSVDQAVSEASFPISEFPEGLNNSYSHTEFMTAQSKTSGYRVNLDTVTSSYEEASGYEPETVSSTYRDDIQVSPAIKNETVVSPVIIQESNVSFSLGKEVKIAPTLFIEEEAKVVPTLIIEEEAKVAPTLVTEKEAKVVSTLIIEEEAKVAPTLVIEEEEEKVVPTLVVEEEAKVAPTLVIEEEAKVVPTLIIEEEEEKVAPTLVVEEEAKVAPTLVVEEEAKVAPTLVIEEEEEKVVPTLVVEEEAKVAPTLVIEEEAKVVPTLIIEEEEEKVAPTLVIEEEAKVVPTLIIEEEEEKVAPTLVVEEEAKVVPTLIIEEEEEKVAPTLVVEEEAKVVPTLVIEEEAKVAPTLVTEEEEEKVAPTLVIEEEAKVAPTLSFKETKVAPTLVVEEEAKVAPTQVFEEAKFNQTFDHKEDAKASTSLVLEGEDKIPQGLDYEEEVNGAAPFEDVIISPSDSQTSKWALLTTTTRPQMALKDVEFSQKMSSTPPSHSSTKPTVAPTEETSISFTSTTHWSRRTWSPTTTTHKVFHKTAEPQKVTHVIPPVDHGLADVEISLTQPPTLLILPNERAAVGGTGKSSDACLDNPCLNGGTCTEWNGKIKCLCLPTYGEDFCQTDLERCEPGWDKFQGFCYRHSAQRQSWEVAEQHCRMMGAHLVSIMNPEEQDYINSNYKEYQWTGLNDKMIEDDFRWSDGNPLLYENWYRGQPDSYFLSGEDCVVMVWHDNGRWSDVPCNYHLAYTCKKGTSSCGPPPKVRNASIFGKPRQRYETNAVVRYHCAEGFQQRLNPLIRCQSGGRWERPQILCIPEAEASMQFPDETSQTDSNFAAAENMFEATEETPLYKDIKF
ncbi:brevican core protein-like isoform X6 [Melanotaenia boesemani]|uniref:brevican core protein-like isoform X6 n=1 Tax=Melanotaenia boesemani TaxID=1250792 RepID=UPI001C04170B|nr:brevican core protein-like isoform X6 [Melanotaenia boesemani]